MPSLAIMPAIALEEVKTRHARWWRAWFLGYLLLAGILATGAALVDDTGLQSALSVGAIGSVLGVLGMLLSPLGPRTRLRMGTLEDYAVWERKGRGVLNHVVGSAVVIGQSAVLLLHFNLPLFAFLILIIGLVLNQSQLRTQHTGASRLIAMK